MRCEKWSATISTDTCLHRQERNRMVSAERKCWSNGNGSVIPFPACRDCEQGKEIKKSKAVADDDIKKLKEEKMAFVMQNVAKPPSVPKCKNHPERPARIGKKGHSTGFCVECLQDRARRSGKYGTAKQEGVTNKENLTVADDLIVENTPEPEIREEVLTVAAIKEEPVQLAVVEQEATSKPMCPNHPDRPQRATKHGSLMGYCAECISDFGKINGAKAWKNKRTVSDGSVVVNFQGFDDIKDWLQSSSAENFRTVEMEVLFWLRQAMKAEHDG